MDKIATSTVINCDKTVTLPSILDHTTESFKLMLQTGEILIDYTGEHYFGSADYIVSTKNITNQDPQPSILIMNLILIIIIIILFLCIILIINLMNNLMNNLFCFLILIIIFIF